MKLTVRECLELDAFNPCKIAAGKRNLNNPVSSISVLDSPDVKSAVRSSGKRDHIVLTSFSAMRGKPTLQSETVKELANNGISALVVFHYPSAEKLSDEAVEIAEAIGLPLIIIPPQNKSEYSDVIDQVMDRLLLGNSFSNNLINNTIYHLLDFERHTNFQSALKEAALTNGFQVVLISKNFNPVLVVENRDRITVQDAIKTLRNRKEQSAESVAYSLLDLNGVVGYWGTVNVSGERYFLLVVDNEDKYTAGEITKLAEIIELAMGMWKYTPERDLKVDLIKALMRGNKSLAYSIKDSIEPKGNQIASVYYGKGINNAKAGKVINDFENDTHCDVVKIEDGEECYGLIAQTPEFDKENSNIKNVCNGLYDELKEISKDVRIFHFTGLDGIEGASDGFRLISETWTFVESVFPYKRVFSKYELVLVSNCINIQVQGGHVKKNYLNLLRPFENEIGQNKAKQLLDTLETFVLDAGMNSGKTSQIMGIHTNTVQYRLKKINEILGVEVTGNRVIPGLTVALALKRLERLV
ncbi:MAG: PucR family transcriptional regulator [Eubacterium sp.]|jgi:hypothetical protein